MIVILLLAIIIIGSIVNYKLAFRRMRAIYVTQGLQASLPSDYASLGVILSITGSLLGLICAYMLGHHDMVFYISYIVLALVGSYIILRIVSKPHYNMRRFNERIYLTILIAFSAVSVMVTIGIVVTLLGETLRFFQAVSPIEFLFGTHWNPQIAFHGDQEANTGSFGAVALFAGTFLISLIAIVVALPIGLISAIYLSEYVTPRTKSIMKPVLEILAGIPTVVYGFFAALAVAPVIKELGTLLHLDVASESALAAGLVMGIMIIPFISSLSEDVLNSIPGSQREGSYALGATQSETIKLVLLPTAVPGICAALLLALSRAIGETMIVVMAAGLVAKLTLNPLDAVTTITVQIVTLLIGDAEFDNPRTLAAFALGLVLFIVTLLLNIISLYILNKKKKNFGTL